MAKTFEAVMKAVGALEKLQEALHPSDPRSAERVSMMVEELSELVGSCEDCGEWHLASEGRVCQSCIDALEEGALCGHCEHEAVTHGSDGKCWFDRDEIWACGCQHFVAPSAQPAKSERIQQLEAMREETSRWTTQDRDSSLEAIDEAIRAQLEIEAEDAANAVKAEG